MNGGSITSCSCSATGQGDAIRNWGTLNLHPREFGFLTITLPAEHGEGSCIHNDNPNSVMGYEGITGAVKENPNRKIFFVDSKSGATVGVAFGKVDDKGLGDDVCVPTRPGYQITGMSCSKGGGGVVTVSVTYDKLYTVQYVCDNKVVGVKSSCSENTTFSDIINTDFSKISLDGDQKLKDVVKPAAGYKFSNFTYGKENKEVVLSGGTLTNWKDLTDSSFNGVVTVFLNYIDTASDTVKYVASGGHMILDKKSKLTNYSGVNLPIGGLRKVHEPKKVIFDFCGQTIHHNDPNVPFIQGVPGKHIVICNLNMDGGGCK